MLRRAVITDEISQDFLRAVQIAGVYGLDGVELRSAWEKNPHELSDDDIRRIRVGVQEQGMQIPCIAAPVFKCDLQDEAECQAHLEILRQTIRVAEKLDCRLVRGFTFWAGGSFEERLSLIARRLLGTEPILRKSGIKMVIEYDPATSASNSQKLARVLETVASEHIQALWDPGNSIYDPEAERPYPEGYERLKRYVLHVHVKDVKREAGSGKPEACRVGTGDVGFRDVFKRLARDGYDGWLSLETHYRLKSAISDELLALPRGSAFSEGGEEASIESLESWANMMKAEGLL